MTKPKATFSIIGDEMKEQRQQQTELPTHITIDPADIPDEVYTIGCRVLASSIRLALSNPEKRADFERWKAARKAAEKRPKGGCSK